MYKNNKLGPWLISSVLGVDSYGKLLRPGRIKKSATLVALASSKKLGRVFRGMEGLALTSLLRWTKTDLKSCRESAHAETPTA
jgi:hypothetical protein